MPLVLAFFLSGASGLIYQVVWVRVLSNHFGSTVQSAAVVTALFMLGLGIGSYAAGSLADRRHAVRPAWPLAAYGVAEIAIAAAAIAVAGLLPALGPWIAEHAAYTTGPEGWHHSSAGTAALRYGAVVLLLVPITALMGATLTLVIRHRVRGAGALAGRDVADLYGANTLGAAAGCLVTDFLLVPAWGLFTTQLVAAALNVAAGLAALAIARTTTQAPSSPPPAATPEPAGASRAWLWIGLVSILTGFVTMGTEIVWLRHLSSTLRGQRNIFALLLALVLFGLWLGTYLAQRLLVRGIRPERGYAVLQSLFVVSMLLTLATVTPPDLFDADAEIRRELPSTARTTWRMLELGAFLQPLAFAVLIPSAALGASFPLANAYLQRTLGSVGQRAGLLYLASTAGSAAGALVVGLFFFRAFGLQRSAVILVVLAILSIGLLALSGRAAGEKLRPRRLWLATTLAASLALVGYLSLPADHLILRTVPERLSWDYVRATYEGPSESILVTQGLNGGFRLVTNGHSMSGTGKWGQRYMRLFVHLPLLARPESSRVLVICFGVGNTAHAASLHPSVERLEVVDLSIDILRAAPHFVQGNRGVLQDPRVAVFVNDGRQHLRMSPPDSFDLITAEPPPLTNAGAAALYSTEFYRLIESRLKPGGWVTQWLPIYQVTGDVARSLVHTFAEVFPGAAVFSGAGNELILAGVRGGPVRLDPAVLASSLQDREAVAEDLRFVWVGSIEDLLATLVAAPSTISRATGGATTLTDDLPFMEYRSTLFAPRKRLPDELFDPTRLSEICPACFVEGGLPLDLQGLAHRQQILAAIYGSDVFLEPAPPADPALREARRPFVLPTSSAAIALLESTPYLRIMKRMYWRGGGER